MMANLDADELVSVKENIAELADKMNSPDQCMYLLQFLMNDTILREIVCITTISDFSIVSIDLYLFYLGLT